MNDRSEAQKLIARLEAEGDTEDMLVSCLIADLRDYDEARQAVEKLQSIRDHHRALVTARANIVVEAAQLRREQAIGAHWTTVLEADMPAVYPL